MALVYRREHPGHLVQEEPKMWNSAAGMQREKMLKSSGIRCMENLFCLVFEQYVKIVGDLHK